MCLEEEEEIIIVRIRLPRQPAESAKSKEKYSPRRNIPQHLVNRSGYGPRGSRLAAIDKDKDTRRLFYRVKFTSSLSTADPSGSSELDIIVIVAISCIKSIIVIHLFFFVIN